MPNPANNIYSIVDKRNFQLRIRGRTIQPDELEGIRSLEKTLSRAEQLLEEAEAEGRNIRQQARQEGFREGRNEAFKQIIQSLLDAEAQSKATIENANQQQLALAFEVVQRVLPKLSSDAIMRDLLEGALREIQHERYLTVRIHPRQKDIANTIVEEWRTDKSHYSVGIKEDNELKEFDCVIESELGEIHAGLSGQLAQLKEAATRVIRGNE